MGVTYGKDEIVSASRVARTFGKVLSDLRTQQKRRIAISKNNELEAIILPVEEYEAMAEALSLLEHIEIHHLVQARKRKGVGKRITLEALLKEQRIAV
jgi:PHD/YefM family antitoxin component YafN of YafNO toxin-antitoxin module